MFEHLLLSWGNEAAKYVYKENVNDNWIDLFQFPVVGRFVCDGESPESRIPERISPLLSYEEIQFVCVWVVSRVCIRNILGAHIAQAEIKINQWRKQIMKYSQYSAYRMHMKFNSLRIQTYPPITCLVYSSAWLYFETGTKCNLLNDKRRPSVSRH